MPANQARTSPRPAGDKRIAGRLAFAAFTLVELLVVLAILSILAFVILSRFSNTSAASRKAACYAYTRDINVQVRLWWRNKGSWPANNLADIGANGTYFPEGLPKCPVDGSAYVLDTATHRVTGHSH